jgi:hypothetical protein
MMEEKFSVDATVQEIETLLDQFGRNDPGSRAAAEELVRLLVQLYGAGLRRVVTLLRESGPEEIMARLAEDRLVGSLLLLHGLHPDSTEERVRKALHRLERGLESHRLELAGIEDGIARVYVVRNGAGQPPAMLAATIESALAEWAPDLAGVEVEGLVAASLVQIQT